METVAVAAMVRNEADRYLPSALDQWSEWADVIALLDNGSTDHTENLARSFDKVAYAYEPAPAWGQEAQIRAALWDHAEEQGTDWIIVLDADMTPAHNPRDLLLPDYGSIAFNLYDLWQRDPLGYRADGHWKAHENWRIWAARVRDRPAEGWRWSERGIHCGHLPWNYEPGRVLYAPCDYGLLHYAYLRNEDRERKFEQYAEEADQLTEREAQHVESILDPDPSVRSLPFEPEYELVHEEDR